MTAFTYCIPVPSNQQDSDDPKPEFDTPCNRYGVKVNWMFGNPAICDGCRFIEYPEYYDDGSLWAAAFCKRGLFLPARKGTCKSRKGGAE